MEKDDTKLYEKDLLLPINNEEIASCALLFECVCSLSGKAFIVYRQEYSLFISILVNHPFLFLFYCVSFIALGCDKIL